MPDTLETAMKSGRAATGPGPGSAAPAGAPWVLVLTAALLSSLSCSGGDDSPLTPAPDLRIEFSSADVDLGAERQGFVTLRNTGGGAVGPIEILPAPVKDAGGATVPGAELTASPGVVSTLNQDQSVEIRLDLAVPGDLESGFYSVSVEALAPDEGVDARLDVLFAVAGGSGSGGTNDGDIAISVGPGEIRQGDVVRYGVSDSEGLPLADSLVAWRVEPAEAGAFGAGGRFVAYSPGDAMLIATAGQARDSLLVSVTPRDLTGSFSVAGSAEESHRHTSDLWLHGDYAYSGTWGVRSGTGGAGNTLFSWSVAGGGAPQRLDSVQVDARVVNDIKVRADGTLGVMTHEGSNDGLNGVTLLDLSDPGHPQPITRFTQGLESGIHNVWIDGDYVYLVLDGTGNGLRVLDVSDPASPTVVSQFWAGSSFLHDVYVRDGLAFLSHWNAGLIILDVGHGMAGGSPESPVEVGRILTQGGQTHNAWYWPEKGYVFVGEEDFASPGIMHVVDVSEMAAPREVAVFEVPGQTPHNFWLDEGRGVLYMAWYGNGIRALDVSGELMGDLTRQGREIAGLSYNGSGGAGSCVGASSTCAWAPQLHQDQVYVSDLNAGLVVLDPSF